MNINSINMFIAVAKEGRFATIARHFNIDPSLVSRTISNLESELGFRLFHRTTRKIALTEAGRLYFSRAVAAVEELEQAQDEAHAISSGPHGTLRLSVSVAYGQKCIIPLLSKFRAELPDIHLELLISDENLDLVSNRIDLAIRLAPTINTDVICAKLHQTKYRVAASPEYIKSSPKILYPIDIDQHNLILSTLEEYKNSWLFKNKKGEVIKIPVKANLNISNALAIQEAALNGLGIALIADWMIDEDLKNGKCIDIFPNYEVAATSFETAAWMIYSNRKFLPMKVRATIDFLTTHLKN